MTHVTSVTVSPKNVKIKPGEWYENLNATVLPANADKPCVAWTSSNENVVSVSSFSGAVYGMGLGTAVVYATSIDGTNITDCCTFTVTNNIPITNLGLDKTALSMQLNENRTLSATFLPANATNKALTWCSDNTNVVTVNNGTLSSVATGNAVITAYTTDGSNLSASCAVNVTTNTLVRGITVSEEAMSLTVGKSKYITAAVCPTNATNKCVVWTSANPAIATVNPTSGLITALSEGNTIITATAADGSGIYGHCSLVVKNYILVESISVTPTSMTTNVGEVGQLSATVCPENCYNKTIQWTSSDKSIVSVNSSTGKITALSVGIATISAKATDGSMVIGTCKVTVQRCGGDQWRNVLNHQLVLQNDGYYVCSKCGYRIKSPALQDKDVLSTEDYYKVLSCYASLPYYSKIDRENEGNYSIKATALRIIIDDIRSKTEYSQKYEYSDSEGNYVREYTTGNENDGYYMPVDIEFTVIDSNWKILLHNGVVSGVVELFTGWFIPDQYQYLFVDTTDGYAVLVDFLSFLASLAGMKEIGMLLDVILVGAAFTSIEITDIVVEITFSVGAGVYKTKNVFNANGELKYQEDS